VEAQDCSAFAKQAVSFAPFYSKEKRGMYGPGRRTGQVSQHVEKRTLKYFEEGGARLFEGRLCTQFDPFQETVHDVRGAAKHIIVKQK
jgi:hypothetical protein